MKRHGHGYSLSTLERGGRGVTGSLRAAWATQIQASLVHAVDSVSEINDPVTVAYFINLSNREKRQADLHDFEGSLSYLVNSRSSKIRMKQNKQTLAKQNPGNSNNKKKSKDSGGLGNRISEGEL